MEVHGTVPQTSFVRKSDHMQLQFLRCSGTATHAARPSDERGSPACEDGATPSGRSIVITGFAPYLQAMPRPAQSLAVVGADYPNKRGPGRRFEIALCMPGEAVELRPEPKNPADSRAIGVYSARDVQIGYIQAEYAQWIGGQLAVVRAIFQRADTFGAVIRVTFDGSTPVLPVEKLKLAQPTHAPDEGADPDWPPREPTDDFGDI